MSIVINGIKMPEAPDEKIELAIYGDGTVIQTYESWRSPEDGKCYWTVTNPEKFGNAISVPENRKLKKRIVYRGDVFNALESARIIALDGILTDRYKDGFHDGLKRALEILANEVQDVQILEMYMPFFIPKWIPVTDQLPPAEKEVYVTDGEYIARANLLDEVFPGDKPCWSYSGLGEITHWCEKIPLPKEDE